MINFCTLFDSNYLTRGLALYESLAANCEDFRLFIFAFDDECYQALKQLDLEKAHVISLRQFEDEQLLAIKPTRSPVEYCWTCTSSTIKYVLENFEVESCTYLDADLYFFASPQPLFDEMGSDSVAITEHRYSRGYNQSSKSGKYCVQFMTFKDDPNGLEVLNWWRDACIDWCYARHEDGKFGDQKYLDEWTKQFKGVHVLKNLAAGLAPWNIQQYEINQLDGHLLARHKSQLFDHKLVFYHFHHLRFYTNGRIDLGGYRLSNKVKKMIYKPYVEALEQITPRVHCKEHTDLKVKNHRDLLRYIKRLLLSNIIPKEKLLQTA